jgi:hypothetical protein
MKPASQASLPRPASARRPALPPTCAERAAGAPGRSAAASRVHRAEGAGQRKSDDGEQQATNLGRAQSAEHHRPIPVGAQSGQEGRDVGEVEGLRRSSFLADQPATPAGPAAAEMAQHPPRGEPQSLATPDYFGNMYVLSQICGGSASYRRLPVCCSPAPRWAGCCLWERGCGRGCRRRGAGRRRRRDSRCGRGGYRCHRGADRGTVGTTVTLVDLGLAAVAALGALAAGRVRG